MAYARKLLIQVVLTVFLSILYSLKQVEVVHLALQALLYGGSCPPVGLWHMIPLMPATLAFAKIEHGGVRAFTALGNTAQQSQGFGITAFGQQDNFDGLLALSARDKGTTRYGGGYRAQNDETIINLLSKDVGFVT